MKSSKSRHSLKKFELPVNRFVNVALPLYLDLLEKHERNIAKVVRKTNCTAQMTAYLSLVCFHFQFRNNREWERMRIETVNAGRTAHQLAAAVDEMETVRSQLTAEEVREFDSQIAAHKKIAVDALRRFEAVPKWGCTDDETTSDASAMTTVSPRLLRPHSCELSTEEIDLEQRKAQFETWKNLQQDIDDLHDLFAEFSHNVHVIIGMLTLFNQFQLDGYFFLLFVCLFFIWTLGSRSGS